MYVEREATPEFASAARANSIVAVVGPRQAGKTTFLKELSEKSGASYLFFDDPDVREMFDEDIKKFENQYLQGDRLAVLDEVQYGKDPGRKLKYLADAGKKLWITSSSETILSKEVLSWLVGRVAIIRMYPFSLGEFLSAKGHRETTENVLSRSVEEHIKYGGYPKVVLERDNANKEALLRNLYETMVLKDMSRTFKIDDAGALERLSAYLSHYVGNVIQYNSVCRDVGLSFQSVKKYMDAMEKSYLIVRVMPFYKNRLKEITKQPKLYFLDTGLRNAVANDFRKGAESDGKVFENYVLSELMKAGKKVRYWQTKGKAEVDFVVQDGDRAIPIEVKIRSPEGTVGTGMRQFIEAYGPREGFVVFKEGGTASAEAGACKVRFVNVRTLIAELRKRTSR